MFEKYTERARKVMSFSRQEAQSLNQGMIGTEAILLGIVKEGGGVAAKVLKNLKVDLQQIRQEAEKLVQPDPTACRLLGQLPFSPRAKRVIELSGEAASQLSHDVIGTEHILLGLLKENEGIAAQVLINLGLKLEETRDMILEVLGQDPDSKGGTAKAATLQAQGSSAVVTEATVKVNLADSTSALSSQDKAEMVVAAWLARGGQEHMPNHTEYLTKMIAFAIEASKRGA